jgi:EAL domain-containing protein (putative c-di-GMP-specific phosphodiesterase class I)
VSTNCRALTAPPISVVRARRRSRKDPSIAKGRQQLLRMVLNNMSQGVLMFAPDTRLVFCNRRASMVSTAEGVETTQQLEQLQSVGCTGMQGYLFSQARPAHEISRLFLRNNERKTATG